MALSNGQFSRDFAALRWLLDGVDQTSTLRDLNLANALAPDTSLTSLFMQSLAITNGSVATAMSTLITVLSSMAYYDSMPQFQTVNNATQVFLETVLYPHSHRGFAAVVAVIAIHWVLIAVITAAFLMSSRYTVLGSHWQAASQLSSPETETILLSSSMVADKDVKKNLDVERREHVRVGIAQLEDEDKVGIVALNLRARHSGTQRRRS